MFLSEMKPADHSGDNLLWRSFLEDNMDERMKVHLAGLFPTCQHYDAISAGLLPADTQRSL